MAAFCIAGELSVQQAAAQRETLLAWLAETDPTREVGEAGETATVEPVLDLSQVEACDSAGVQLVLALQRSMANRGQTLQLGGASAPVTDALRRFGLQALLAAPASADA